MDHETSPSDVRWLRLSICVGVATVLWLSPGPADLPREAWHTFAVFAGVICGFLLRPMPMAPVVLLGLTTLVVTSTISIDTELRTGFGNKTVWLVVSAFLIAGAVESTGLGRRIALHLIHLLGRSMLGLGYAIAATELVLGPFVPSNTARGGGMVAPVVRGLARTLESEPERPGRNAAFLIQTGSHANLVCSAMFLTAMAGNLLLVKPAQDIFGVEWDFTTWLKGAIVPGLIGLACIPPAVYLLDRPETRDVSAVRSRVARDLVALGPWSRRERALASILIGLLVLWSTGKFLSSRVSGLELHTTTVAFLGVLAIVLSGVQRWREMIENHRVWDALIWLGGFVALAEALKSTGFTVWLEGPLSRQVGDLSAVPTVLILGIIYFFTMYCFSQLTAHITALAGVFLALAHGADAPPFLVLAVISYFSCLCGALTPWSSGPVIVYFSFGYVSVGRWMRNGLVIALMQITIWLTVGMAWWKVLEWW